MKCLRCSRKARAGRALCKVCAKKGALGASRRRAEKRKAGRCTVCGRPLPWNALRKRCRTCREVSAEKERRRYWQRRDENRCVRCGKPSGTAYCGACLEYVMAYQ